MTTLKIAYGTATTFTWTSSNSLTTSSTLLGGATSLAVANTSTLADDYIISGVVTGGTAPAVNTVIEIWCYASADNGAKYSGGVSGTDVTTSQPASDGAKNLMALVVAIQNTVTTNAQVFQWGPYSVANLFGGTMPDHFGLWIVQNTAVTISASNPATYTAITYTNA